MSVLVDSEIRRAHEQGKIIIEPWSDKALGTNSYDVHLHPVLRVYKPEYEHVRRVEGYKRVENGHPRDVVLSDEIPLDVRVKRETVDIVIPEEGFVLQPNELYLASTVEYTESLAHLPILNGRSSIGRYGLSIHVTAGTGDIGFRGHWTMELFVIKPLRIYPRLKIGQLLWFHVNEQPEVPYDLKQGAKYNNRDPLPMASQLHQEHARVREE